MKPFSILTRFIVLLLFATIQNLQETQETNSFIRHCCSKDIYIFANLFFIIRDTPHTSKFNIKSKASFFLYKITIIYDENL